MNAPSLNLQQEQMDEWQDIGAAETFSSDEPTAVQAQGVAIAVFRLEDGLFALHDLCTHGNARLSDGYVENDCVECPLHQGLFDIRSGEPRCAPVTSAVRRFPLRVVAGRIEVNIQQASAQSASSHSCIAVEPAKTYLASVSSIERLAPDVAMLRLSTDAAMPYQPGQYLNVLLNNGEQRSYSMANVSGLNVSGVQPSQTSPATSQLLGSHLLELHIRHLPGGLFTDHVFSNLGVGNLLNLEGPQGNFVLSTSKAPAIFLASGTGFAPIKAMMEAAIQDGNTRLIALYWGGRRPQDLYLQSLCQQWSDRFAWFRFVPVLSAAMPEDAWDGRNGLVRNGLVHSAVLEDHPDLSGYEVYACGAPRMIDAARRDFIGLAGLPADAFFADAFVSRADRAADSS